MIEQYVSTFKGPTYNTVGKAITYDRDLIELIIEQNNHIISQNNELLRYLKERPQV